MEAPILEGPPAQNPISFTPISKDAGLAADGDDAACRSDPTFTRASPGLAVAEQLPQIVFTITIIIKDTKEKRGHKTHVNFARSTSARTQADCHQLPSPWSSALPLANTAVQLSPAKSS